jgi:hypothetical protein
MTDTAINDAVTIALITLTTSTADILLGIPEEEEPCNQS